VNDRPQAGALLAALRHDLAGIRAQLDRLSDDELSALRGALYDVAIELWFTSADRRFDLGTVLVRDTLGDSSACDGDRRCPAPDCGRRLDSPRAHYCSGRCRMRALRQRRLMNASHGVVGAAAPPARRPVDHCVYECVNCDERFLGERRCPECRLFNRNLGLGAPCPECDHPIVLSELVPDLIAAAPTLTAGRRRN
jgi:hypothetical protein